MPIYDKVIIGKKAKKLGFVRDALEKMSRLSVILQHINENDSINRLLALKGGTAINLTVLNLPRLSVDLDFDFTENLSKEETQEKREIIKDVIERYMNREDYTVNGKTKRTHALDSFVYAYTNAAGNKDNIKIEINYSLRCHLLPIITGNTKTSGILPDFTARTLSPIEIYAGKSVALSDRAAARDLYDLNNMVIFALFDECGRNLLRKCAVFYMAVSGEINTQGFSHSGITKITQFKIRTELLPMIRSTERFDLMAAQERVTDYMNKYMVLTENETTFLKQFSIGQYEPQLLFDDADIIKRIENHPMVLWRLQHIREG